MTDQDGDRKFSKASIDAGVQAAFALCATCVHTRGSHPEDGKCSETWEVGEPKDRRTITCGCGEYWPVRRDVEDGMTVGSYAVGFGGTVELKLDRRITTEFWDELRQGRSLTVLMRVGVAGKAFTEKDLLLKEVRKLHVEQLYFIQPETLEDREVLDALGREVDPETGEILGGEE